MEVLFKSLFRKFSTELGPLFVQIDFLFGNTESPFETACQFVIEGLGFWGFHWKSVCRIQQPGSRIVHTSLVTVVLTRTRCCGIVYTDNVLKDIKVSGENSNSVEVPT